MSDGRYDTANTMAERVEAGWRLQFLFHVNRIVVTVVLAAIVFVTFVAIGEFAYPQFEAALATKSTIEMLFGSMLGAIITGVTLVVTISQIILAQETGPLGDQHQRMNNSMDFRQFLGELLGHPVPPAPSAFLQTLIENIRERALLVREATTGSTATALQDDIEELTDSIVGNAREVESRLESAQFGTFEVVSAALDFNYGADIYFIEDLTHRYEDELTDVQTDGFDELKTSLTMFGPAREHVKTLYFQWELANLSKYILYAAIPAIAVAGLMVSYVDGGTFTGHSVGVADIILVAGAAFTVTVLPFLLLTAYILRIVTVAKHTLAIGPLVLRDSE